MPSPPAGLQLLRESGWGLTLVAALADRWGVTVDGLVHVWFELDRDGAASDARA